MSQRGIDEVIEETLLTLRMEDHDGLADELAETFRHRLSRTRWILRLLKSGLCYGLLLGSSATVAIGFVRMLLREEYLGAVLVLLLGCLVFAIVVFLSAIGESFEEYLQEEGLGTQRSYTHGYD